MSAEPNHASPPPTLDVNADGVPPALRALRQWVGWQWEFRDRWTKPPVRVMGQGYAKSTDPDTWATFATAVRAYERRKLAGIGFALAADGGIAFVDLDHCRDPESGAIADWAEPILAAFRHTYIEISPSETGIKIIGRGTLSGNEHTRIVAGGGRVELFDRAKYTTVTGHRLPESGTDLADIQIELDTLSASLFAPKAEAEPIQRPRPQSGPFDDAERLELTRASKQGTSFAALFDRGDATPYGGDQSAADLALCNILAFWLGADPVRIDQAFRRSALMRAKWDEVHAGDGRTYGEMTIDTAIEARAETYSEPRWRVFAGGRERDGEADGDGEEQAEEPTPEGPRPLTDLGNAERFVAQHGEIARYSVPWSKWLIWDGTRWELDGKLRVMQLAKQTARSILDEAIDETDKEQRTKILKHAFATEGERRLAAMVTLARSFLPVTPETLDAQPWLLNTDSGTVDLKTGELRPHDRGDLLTKIAPVTYDPDARCPRFLAFLDRIMEGKTDAITFLQRAIGYSLTGSTVERIILILYGEGKNGKSTLLEVIRALLGDYARRTPTETLLVNRHQNVPNDVARLQGIRFVSASEAEEGQRLAEAKVKDLTGGDTVTARFFYGEFFDFAPTFKLWLSTNHKPVVRGTDHAIWDRIKLVPFLVRIPQEEQDPHLKEALIAEGPGILQWAIQGCLDWQRDGLGEPESVRQATAAYRSEMDVIGAFLGDRCELGRALSVTAKDLYAAYTKWCDETGEKPLTQTAIGRRLTERGLDQARDMSSRMWIGISLKSSVSEPSFSANGRRHEF